MTEQVMDVAPSNNMRVEAARTFVGLVFPRLMGSFTEQVQDNIDALKMINKGGGKGHQSVVDKKMQQHQKRLKKILSEKVQTTVFDKMVALLAAELTEEELRYAIFQERVTIKISGVAAQLETAFQEAIGED